MSAQNERERTDPNPNGKTFSRRTPLRYPLPRTHSASSIRNRSHSLHPSSSFLFIYVPSPGKFSISAKILYEPSSGVYQINQIPTPAHLVSQTPLRTLSIFPDEPVSSYNPTNHPQTHNGIRNGKAPGRQDGRCDRCFGGNW